MLELSKKGVSTAYRVIDLDTGGQVSVMTNDGSWQSGSMEIAGRVLTFEQDLELGNAFSATQDGRRIASATRPNEDGRRRYVLDAEGSTLELEVHRIGQKPFEATIDGEHVGALALQGFAGRRVRVDLPDRLPIGVQMFSAWLALRDWNKAANVRAYN